LECIFNYKLDKPINTELYDNFLKNKIMLYIKLVIKHYYKQIIFTILILIIIYKLIKSKK
jgi:hypothetical protein